MNRQLLLLIFFGLYEVVLAVFLLESLDSACGIDEFLLSSVERVADRADFGVDFLCGAAGLESVAAAAMDDYLIIFWMYVFFHNYNTPIR